MDQSEIDELIVKLGSSRWADRRAGEDGLHSIGYRAVPALVDSLNSGSDQVRWGAAKVLGMLADPAATPALLDALEDARGGVRWLAAQALIAIGPSVVPPVLRRLLSKPVSPWLQEGAHHVLRGLPSPTVTGVIRALEGHFPELTVPVAASEAMEALGVAAEPT